MFVQRIRELAESEKFPDPVTVTEEGLRETLFGPRPAAKALLGFVSDEPVSFAVFYETIATTTGRRRLHLDDLFVRPRLQGRGCGKAMLGYLFAWDHAPCRAVAGVARRAVSVASDGRWPHHEDMPFVVGAAVAVVSIRKHGHVLEVLPGRRYRVAVGSMTIVCQESQLETVSHSKKEQRRARQAPARHAATATPPPVPDEVAARGCQSIDLHGMTVPEVLAALPPFLDRAIRAGLTHVEIIHGISGGRLRTAVRGYLAGMPAVACAALDDKNPGVTIAYF